MTSVEMSLHEEVVKIFDPSRDSIDDVIDAVRSAESLSQSDELVGKNPWLWLSVELAAMHASDIDDQCAALEEEKAIISWAHGVKETITSNASAKFNNIKMDIEGRIERAVELTEAVRLSQQSRENRPKVLPRTVHIHPEANDFWELLAMHLVAILFGILIGFSLGVIAARALGWI